MELPNSFTVAAGIEATWDTLMDIERVAPCMPGATLTSFDGEVINGTVKVKLGPVQMTYAGQATIVEKDAVAHVAVIEAKGRESRGTGTAVVKARAVLHAESESSTRVDVVTDLTISGKAAQFGRGVMQDVAARIIDQFADNLAALMSGQPAPGEEPSPVGVGAGGDGSAGAQPTMPHDTEAIDLLGTAGTPVLKRLAPGLVVLGVLVWWLVSRRRGH